MDFTNRIKKKYAGCELLPPKVDPTPDDHLASDKQFLQISKVTAAAPGQLRSHTHRRHHSQSIDLLIGVT